jgi:hypothetical protein
MQVEHTYYHLRKIYHIYPICQGVFENILDPLWEFE